jgi:hypothetical protein
MTATTSAVTAELQPDAAESVPLRRIAGLFRPYPWSVAALVVVAALQAMANVASPFLSEQSSIARCPSAAPR